MKNRVAIALGFALAMFTTAVACQSVSALTAFGGAPTGSFVATCGYSHRLPDDPIVHPGMTGVSHSHDFFGNRSTNAESTLSSLASNGSKCNRSGDLNAYWVPTVLYHGHPVTPIRVQVYYNNNHRPNVKPLPRGLKIVAGDARATGPQDTNTIAWQCTDQLGSQPRDAMPRQCPSGTLLKLVVRFPGCWDGMHLDSPDHKSHMAYAAGNQHDGPCPPGYPVQVVSANPEFKYPISDGTGVTLSSGAAYTAHADFFDAWDETTMQQLVDTCINAGVQCHVRG